MKCLFSISCILLRQCQLHEGILLSSNLHLFLRQECSVDHLTTVARSK